MGLAYRTEFVLGVFGAAVLHSSSFRVHCGAFGFSLGVVGLTFRMESVFGACGEVALLSFSFRAYFRHLEFVVINLDRSRYFTLSVDRSRCSSHGLTFGVCLQNVFR